jgi:hypothetical protein
VDDSGCKKQSIEYGFLSLTVFRVVSLAKNNPRVLKENYPALEQNEKRFNCHIYYGDFLTSIIIELRFLVVGGLFYLFFKE